MRVGPSAATFAAGTAPTPSPMILRILPLLITLAVSLGFTQEASARRLSNADLRRYGFSGVYRGDVRGFIRIRDDEEFDTVLVSQRAREILPVRNREIITGPGGRNGFHLVKRSVSGNQRRVVIRLYYSGRSYNPDYDRTMVGSGTKILTVRKFGGAVPQFEMSLIDRLQERGIDGTGIYTVWDVRGRLGK